MSNELSRREWLTTMSAAGLLPLAGVEGATLPREGRVKAKTLFTLETGHRADRGGPIVTTKEGRVLWFTVEPEAPQLERPVWPLIRLVARQSQDAGRTWGEGRTVAQGTHQYGLLSHVAWQLTRGDLIHIYARYGGYDFVNADPDKSINLAVIQRSSNGGREWSKPALLPTGKPYVSDVLSMVQLASGRVIYPFGFLSKEKAQFKISVLYSDDEARSWNRSPSVLEVGGAGFESGASEPSVAELADGRLWMVIRAQTGFLWESFSTDRGHTWEEARPSRFPSSNAPGSLLRLSSGKIVLVWNNQVDSAYARQSLVVAVSEEGRKFSAFREIDYTDFPADPEQKPDHVTYPFLAEAPDGSVLVSYNHGTWRRHNRPKLARIDPGWIEVRSEVEDFRNGRVAWCTRNGAPGGTAAVERYAPPEDNLPGASIEILQPENSQQQPVGITRNLACLVEGQMKVTLSVLRAESYLLWHDTMLAPGKVAAAFLRVRFARDGKVFLAAGTPTTECGDRFDRQLTYSHLAYPIKEERPYPNRITPGKRLDLTLSFSAAERQRRFVSKTDRKCQSRRARSSGWPTSALR